MQDTTQITKTTLELDSNLLYLAKMRALQEGKTLKDIVTESLETRLIANKKEAKKERKLKIGGYKLGGIKGSLKREEIYEDF